MCFQHCVDNFFTRDISANESSCLDKCVLKFSNINQRVMGTYIAEQSVINKRRMEEVEVQMQAHSESVLNAVPSVTPTIAHTDGGAASIPEEVKVTDYQSQNST